MDAPRLLLAGIPETNDRVSRALRECNVTVVSSMTDALTALRRPYDVILIAVSFDESRMFDLLRHLRAEQELSHIPVICYRSKPGPITTTKLAREAVSLAARTLGADEYIDLLAYADDDTADSKLRNTVFELAAKHRRR